MIILKIVLVCAIIYFAVFGSWLLYNSITYVGRFRLLTAVGFLVVALALLSISGCAYTRHCHNITENGGYEGYDEKECIAEAEFEKNIYWQYLRELRWL